MSNTLITVEGEIELPDTRCPQSRERGAPHRWSKPYTYTNMVERQRFVAVKCMACMEIIRKEVDFDNVNAPTTWEQP